MSKKNHRWNESKSGNYDKCQDCGYLRLRAESGGLRYRRSDNLTWSAAERVPPCEPAGTAETKKHQKGKRPRVPGQALKKITADEGKAARDRLKVYELKVHRALSFRQIAAVMGNTPKAAWQLFHAYMDDLNAQTRPIADYYREVETARLELQRKEVKEIIHFTDDADVALKAHTTLLRIADRFAKLHGLDAPTQILIKEGVKEHWDKTLRLLKSKDEDLAKRAAEIMGIIADEQEGASK